MMFLNTVLSVRRTARVMAEATAEIAEALSDMGTCLVEVFMGSRFGWGESVYLCYTQLVRDGFSVLLTYTPFR